jgi:hypothetical protein
MVSSEPDIRLLCYEGALWRLQPSGAPKELATSGSMSVFLPFLLIFGAQARIGETGKCRVVGLRGVS